MNFIKDQGSFRDPAGYVFEYNNRIIRIIKKLGADKFQDVISSDIINESIKNNFLINTKNVTSEFKNYLNNENCIFLEHQKIDYISYPYEWSFNQLKDAALFHLEFQLFLLDKNFILKDSSAFNIQFNGNKPIFIDALSIEKYKEGEYWKGHSQFLQQFLNPLLLKSIKGIDFNNWFKGNLNGISTSELNDILTLKDKLSLNVFFSVSLLAKLEKKNKFFPEKALEKVKKQKKLSKKSYSLILIQLKNWINKLKPKFNKSNWDTYSFKNTYEIDQEKRKLELVKAFINLNEPNYLADIGCNDGIYSIESLNEGAKKVIGFDIDLNSIDKAYIKAKKENLNFLPLYFDAMNPSSNLGWNEKERKSFKDRVKFDAFIALAFIHHLIIGNNIPLNEAVKWLTDIAPKGLIEFVDKEDQTVQTMLALKGDIFPNYDIKNFEKSLSEYGKILKKTNITSTRILYEFNKN